ncbi:response regulator transcription factor [Dyadobacter sp. 3J3]|uniref:LuxR C-terminal-related transcriptional regulator n=1 Tax=Dyadobacter sp. 3J3 TaxID=2606600 RepID=UPI001357425E|nr:response regulator transcription factor [Dyadobacter sp. 3J3]
MKIFIASDNSIFRLGIGRIIENLYANAKIEDGQIGDLLEKSGEWAQFELIVLHKPNSSNILSDLLRKLKLSKSTVKVLVLSDDVSFPEMKFLFSLGIKGYSESASSIADISEAIKQILSGRPYIEASLLIQYFNFSNSFTNTVSMQRLSVKELEIATCLVNGLKTNEISKLLNKKATTISTQKNKIFTKLRISNVVELIHYMSGNAENTLMPGSKMISY